MLQRINIILFIFFTAKLFCQNNLPFEKQLARIEGEKNDSSAIVSLNELCKNHSLSPNQVLRIKYELISRTWAVQKYGLALDIAKESELLAHKNKLDSLEALFLKITGITYYFIDRKNESITYFQKALEIANRHGFWELEASCHNNIGGALVDLKKYDEAETALLNSVKILTENGKGNTYNCAKSLRVLARVYSVNKKPEKAEKIYLSLIDRAKNAKDTILLRDNLMFYSDDLAKKGEYDRALEMSSQALVITRKSGIVHDLTGIYGIHAANLYKAGKYQAAYDTIVQCMRLQKKIFSENLEKEVGLVEVKYKTAELKQEKELAELKVKEQRILYIFTFSGVLILLAALAMIISQKRKAKHVTALAEAEKLRFKEVIEAEEKERSRIAQELHDGLGQLLSTARLNVANLEDAVNQEEKAGLNRSLNIIDEACTEVRNVSHNLMPSALIRLGLIPAINELVNNINSAKGIKIDFRNNIESSLGKSLDITIYRVIQEILNNMIRHAKASHIELSIEKQDEDLKIIMKDNGVGFNTDELKNTKGIGWKNIFSRISMMDGDIKLESQPEKGTLVFINLKLSRKEPVI